MSFLPCGASNSTQGEAAPVRAEQTIPSLDQLAVNQNTQMPFHQAALQPLVPGSKRLLQGCSITGAIQHLLLLKFVWLVIAQPSDLSRSLFKAFHAQESQQLLLV